MFFHPDRMLDACELTICATQRTTMSLEEKGGMKEGQNGGKDFIDEIKVMTHASLVASLIASLIAAVIVPDGRGLVLLHDHFKRSQKILLEPAGQKGVV